MNESLKQSKPNKLKTFLLIFFAGISPCFILLIPYELGLLTVKKQAPDYDPPIGKFAIQTPSSGPHSGIDFYVSETIGNELPAPSSVKVPTNTVLHPDSPPGDLDVTYRFASVQEIKSLGVPIRKSFDTGYGTTTLALRLTGNQVSIDDNDGISEVHSQYILQNWVPKFTKSDVKMLNGH